MHWHQCESFWDHHFQKSLSRILGKKTMTICYLLSFEKLKICLPDPTTTTTPRQIRLQLVSIVQMYPCSSLCGWVSKTQPKQNIAIRFNDWRRSRKLVPLISLVNHNQESTLSIITHHVHVAEVSVSSSRQHMEQNLKSHYVNNSCYRLTDRHKNIQEHCLTEHIVSV